MALLNAEIVSAVLFDLDETLLDRTGSLRRFLADQWRRWPVLQQMAVGEFVDAFLALDQRGRVGKDVVYSALLKRIGVENTALTAALLQEYQQNFSRFAQAFDGMDQVLEALRAAGLKIAIVTNGQTEMQLGGMRALGLEDGIDACLISEAEGLRKPDPRIFQRAADRLGVAVERCLFVGDTPEADVLAAQRCGMQAVWFPNGAVWPEGQVETAHTKIDNLSELLVLLGLGQ